MATIHEINLLHARFRDASAAELPGLVDQSLETCRLATIELGNRLAEIGYPVHPCASGPDENASAYIERIEIACEVPIPDVLKRFWEVIGQLSFVDLTNYSHIDFWDERSIYGPHDFCDGVFVEGCNEDFCQYTIEDFEVYVEDDCVKDFRYVFSPDGYHKDDISGGPPYGLSRDRWLPAVTNFAWSGHRVPESAPPGEVDFLGYLRTSLLECGGFPGLLGDSSFEPIREVLIEGLPVF